MRWFREFMKRALPTPVVNWLRRWLGTARYLRFMSYEVHERQSRLERGHLEPLESGLAARRDGFYQQMAKEVVERTDLVLQQLDRKLEGHHARDGERLRALEDEVGQLRRSVDDLKSALQSATVAAERPSDGPTGKRPARRQPRRKLAASE